MPLILNDVKYGRSGSFNMNSKVGMLAIRMAWAPLPRIIRKQNEVEKLKKVENNDFVESWKTKRCL